MFLTGLISGAILGACTAIMIIGLCIAAKNERF